MRLPERGHLLDVRLSVTLTWTVAVLSLITGIANIGTPYLVGPLAGIVPDAIQRTAGFTGALTGFLMLLTAIGMRRRLRLAWKGTVILLPLTAIQGLVQSSPWSIPLIVVSLLALPHVLRNRRRFDRTTSLSTAQIAAAAALVGAQAYGTAGAYVLRDEFRGLDTPFDAFYYALVTASTVGYGDVTPETQTARLFGTTVLIVGTATFAFALGTLLAPAVEARISAALGRMTDEQLALLEDHVIVLGYGDLTESILNELDGTDVVVVTRDTDRAAALTGRGYHTLTGDPTDESVLDRVGIDDALAIVMATDDDGDDALAVLTARQRAPEIRIVAAATDRSNVPKLRRAGADTVLSPAAIGGRLLARSALGEEDDEELVDRLLGERE